MAFINNLALDLILIGLIALTLVYIGVRTYIRYRAFGNEGATNELKSSAPPIGVFGVLMLAIGLYGEFTWPLFTGTPAVRYNMLIYDPTVLFAMILLGFALAFAIDLKTQYVGLFAMGADAITIYYGVQGYSLGMTREPLMLLAVYVSFGAAGIFTFPTSLIIDRMCEDRCFPRERRTRKRPGYQRTRQWRQQQRVVPSWERSTDLIYRQTSVCGSFSWQ